MEHATEPIEVIARLLFQGAGIDVAADAAELENPLFDALSGRASFLFAAEPSGDIGTQGQSEQVGPEPLLAENTVVQAREGAGSQFGKPSCRQVEFADDFGADGYGKDAMECVDVAKRFLGLGEPEEEPVPVTGS